MAYCNARRAHFPLQSERLHNAELPRHEAKNQQGGPPCSAFLVEEPFLRMLFTALAVASSFSEADH